ncbi:hypothetical protein [Leuconostoc falkenbergense]|uniref:hypothetical protein n=1 Tax=Leuconostoc falkenbergense TaxID=2766470 RepID=UPI001FC89BD5|nr:hypothetical protein [Leuconostoc falkenbergense]
MKKTIWHVKMPYIFVILILVVIFGVLTVRHFDNQEKSASPDVKKSTSAAKSKNTFPKGVKSTDWDLVLVNKTY